MALTSCVWALKGEASSGDQEYLVDLVGTQEGLPGYSITGIAQTPEGYLWAGTLYSGLLRYDGVQFVSFDARNTPELPGRAIRRVITDRSGLLWINGYDGSLTTWDCQRGFSLANKNAGRIEALLWSQPGQVIFSLQSGCLLKGSQSAKQWEWSCSEPIGTLASKSLCADRDGRIWVLRAKDQLSVWENGKFRSIAPPFELGGAAMRAVAADNSGKVWVGTDNKLLQWEADRFVDRTPREGGVFQPVKQITCSGGGLWIESEGRLRRFAEGKWQTEWIDWKMGLPNASLQLTEKDNEGGIWATHEKLGLIHVKADGSSRTLSTDAGLPGNSIASIFCDQEGSLWLGYFRGGMVQIRPRLFHSISRQEGFSGALANSVCEDAEGAIWIGAPGTGVFQYKNGKCTTYSLSSPVNEPNTLVTVDRLNQIWMCSHGGELVRFSEGKLIPVVPSAKFPHFVNLLFPARDGRLWIGAQNSISVVEGGQFREVFRTDENTRRPAAIAETQDGTIWAGTFDGYLMRWNGEQFEPQSPPERNTLGRLWSLCPTPDGGMWIGTSEGGLLRWKKGRFLRLTTANGLRSDSIIQVQIDTGGNLWLVSSAGIERIDTSSLARFEQDQTALIPVSRYGRNDGIPNIGGSIEFQPNCWRGADGKLWFAMGSNVANIQPSNVRINTVPPTVVIEELRVNHCTIWPTRSAMVSAALAGPSAPISKIPPVTVHPGQRDLEFRFTGLNFKASRAIQFRYRLQGFEDQWHDVGEERWARYYSVPPGNYIFQVMAANSDNIWNPKPATLAITLQPRFYETARFQWTVLLVAGLLLALIGWIAARVRMRRRMEMLEARRKLELDRVRISKDMHDELGSKLARISYISELAKQNRQNEESARSYISTIAETSRELLRSMDEIVWAVNPRNDFLEHMAAYLV